MEKNTLNPHDASQNTASSKTTRRQFVAGAAGVAAFAAASPLMAGGGHDHHQGHATSGGNAKLMESALECIGKSEICIEHCLATLKDGDTTLAKCLETAKDAIAGCQALVQLSAGDSKHLKALADLCISLCQDCADECKKHKKHPTCQECMDSCNECIKHCKKVA